MKKSTVKTLQIIVELIMLVLFVVLFISKRIQLWMIIFAGSVLLTTLFGRFYCGWICPIHTVQRPLTWLKKKLHLATKPGPAFLRTAGVRWGILAVFVLLLGLVQVSGRQLPVLPALLGLGVLTTLVFSEELWHRWLCPYGTLLSLPARFSRRHLTIRQSGCISCGQCAKACPALAVAVSEPTEAILTDQQRKKRTYQIDRANCLLCLECQRHCPTDTIKYDPQQKSSKA